MSLSYTAVQIVISGEEYKMSQLLVLFHHLLPLSLMSLSLSLPLFLLSFYLFIFFSLSHCLPLIWHFLSLSLFVSFLLLLSHTFPPCVSLFLLPKTLPLSSFCCFTLFSLPPLSFSFPLSHPLLSLVYLPLSLSLEFVRKLYIHNWL